MNSGTITWLGCKFGSGDITVLAVKFERFPDKFCLNRPCFPLSLVQKDRMYLFFSYKRGRPGASELMYWLQWDCSKYHALFIFEKSSPFSIIDYVIFLLRNTMSFIFIVRSSSLDKEFVSITLGLIQTGGTTKSWIIKLFIEVVPPILTKINDFFGILSIMCLAYQGFN
jgi:hypothetical protein